MIPLYQKVVNKSSSYRMKLAQRFVLFESSLCTALLFCCPSKDFGEISDLFQRDSYQHELLGKNENLHL